MKTASLYSKNLFVFIIIIFFSLGLYCWIFTADYLYLDEAYQLWNRHDDKNYTLFATQGRLLSGLIFQKLFSVVESVGEMKYLRMISLAGWIISSLTLYHFSKKWVKELGLNKYLPFLLSIFCICSSAVCVYIGWASCLEVFLAFLFGLSSGHILFGMLAKQKEHFDLSVLKLFIPIALGVISLLIYQNAYGILILPFLLMWIANIPQKKKKMLIAISVYLLTYFIYFMIFKYYLKTLNISAGYRTDIASDPAKKLSFFFSTPFSQAWSLNVLHNLHNIFSQVFPLILFVLWIFLFIKQSSVRKPIPVLIEIAVIIILLILSYLPSVAAKENFSSYRTMIALSLCVFAIFSISILTALKREKRKLLFIPLFSIALFIVAYINFNFKFLHPLRKEFNAISRLPFLKEVNKNDTIIFIRADLKLFKTLYGLKSYKDEFGSPSTYRDWVPEGLIRQLISERQSFAIANAIMIYQFKDLKEFSDSMQQNLKKPVIINVNEVLTNKSRLQ